MNRATQYGLGLAAIVVIIAFCFARDRILDYIFGKVPDWLAMTLVFGFAAFAIGFVAWSQSKVKQPPTQICRKCGYDLRATPDRCPECGTIPLEKRKRG